MHMLIEVEGMLQKVMIKSLLLFFCRFSIKYLRYLTDIERSQAIITIHQLSSEYCELSNLLKLLRGLNNIKCLYPVLNHLQTPLLNFAYHKVLCGLFKKPGYLEHNRNLFVNVLEHNDFDHKLFNLAECEHLTSLFDGIASLLDDGLSYLLHFMWAGQHTLKGLKTLQGQ